MFITRYAKQFLIAALGITIASILALGFFGVTLGIDFTGGSLTEVAYEERPDRQQVEEALSAFDLGGFSVRESVNESGEDVFILRTRDLSEPERIAVGEALVGLGAGGEVSRFTSIGPIIGDELRSKAAWAIGLVALIVVLYVAFAFRSVTGPVRSHFYGLITIVVLAHDVLVPTAVFGVLGYLAGAEVDVLFVMAILAVLGYSVNDTIVVFDRVRENLVRNKEEERDEPFADTVGRSVSQTFERSINTSLTTLLALGALFIIGSSVTQYFALVLIVGVIAGTYSSLFIASPLLILLERRLRTRAAAHHKANS